MTVAIDRIKKSVKVFYHTYVWTVGRQQTLVNNRVSHNYVLVSSVYAPHPSHLAKAVSVIYVPSASFIALNLKTSP